VDKEFGQSALGFTEIRRFYGELLFSHGASSGFVVVTYKLFEEADERDN
jgi:hypothetical protein